MGMADDFGGEGCAALGGDELGIVGDGATKA